MDRYQLTCVIHAVANTRVLKIRTWLTRHARVRTFGMGVLKTHTLSVDRTRVHVCKCTYVCTHTLSVSVVLVAHTHSDLPQHCSCRWSVTTSHALLVLFMHTRKPTTPASCVTFFFFILRLKGFFIFQRALLCVCFLYSWLSECVSSARLSGVWVAELSLQLPTSCHPSHPHFT